MCRSSSGHAGPPTAPLHADPTVALSFLPSLVWRTTRSSSPAWTFARWPLVSPAPCALHGRRRAAAVACATLWPRSQHSPASAPPAHRAALLVPPWPPAHHVTPVTAALASRASAVVPRFLERRSRALQGCRIASQSRRRAPLRGAQRLAGGRGALTCARSSAEELRTRS